MARRVAVAGLALVGVMQLYFVLMGRDRPAAYGPVQGLSALATFGAAYGLSRLDRGGAPWLAIGLGVNALTRVLQVVLDLTRLPPSLNFLVAGAYLLAAIVAGMDAGKPHRHGRVRTALWALTAAHFVFFLAALSVLTAAFGLAMEVAGFALAAAFLE